MRTFACCGKEESGRPLSGDDISGDMLGFGSSPRNGVCVAGCCAGGVCAKYDSFSGGGEAPDDGSRASADVAAMAAAAAAADAVAEAAAVAASACPLTPPCDDCVCCCRQIHSRQTQQGASPWMLIDLQHLATHLQNSTCKRAKSTAIDCDSSQSLTRSLASSFSESGLSKASAGADSGALAAMEGAGTACGAMGGTA
jgi:hypothetical protein